MIDTSGVRDNFPMRIRKNKTFQDFIDGVTLTAIVALMVVVIMLYVTSISFGAEFSLKQIGFEGLILYFATVSIALLSRSYARRKGRNTQKYANAVEHVVNNSHTIIELGYASRTAEYCRKWEEAELRSTRIKVLSSTGIEITEFEEKYIKYNRRELKEKYPELTEDELKTILKTKKNKKVTL